MAYVCVGPDTIKRADDTRQAMIKAAIDFAAGRIEPKEFDNIHNALALALCCESGQPAQADHRQYVLRRLRNFYPVAIRETVDGFHIEYRHNRLPKRKQVTIPDGLLEERQPFCIGLEDVSGKGWGVDVAELKTRTMFGSGPHHLTIEWGTKEKIWAR